MPKSAPLKGPILFIDNEECLCESIVELGDALGYLVISYTSGRAAVEDIENYMKYKIAFVDLSMHGTGGNNVIEASKRVNPSIPVYIFSAYSTIENMYGANGHIVKGRKDANNRMIDLWKTYCK